MKLGTENRKKTIIAAVLVVVAVVLVIRAVRGSGEPNPPALPPGNQPVAGTPAAGPGTVASKPRTLLLAKTLDPSLRFDLLKSSEDVVYKGTGRDIFRSQPEATIPTPLPPDKQPKAVPTTPPPPPPIDLKFYGFAGPKNGAKRVFLLKGEDIFVAQEGDIVDRRYKILHIGPNSIDVMDVLTNNRQSLPLSG